MIRFCGKAFFGLTNSALRSSRSEMLWPYLFVVGWVLSGVLFSQDVPRVPASKPRDGNPPATEANKVNGGIAVGPQVKSLINDAEALPPEFSSDLVLQLLENGFVHDHRLRLKLVNRAFDKASAAKDDVMHGPWGPNREETPDGFHAIASEYTGLDKTSLQTRVVHEALLIDPLLGRRLFDSIQLPQISPAF